MNSYWLESLGNKKKTFPTLTQDLNADICIIGGGLVGVTCAYYLLNSGLKTIVEIDGEKKGVYKDNLEKFDKIP